MSARPFIFVIGDVMLDRHVTCEVVGISPEDETVLKIRPVSVEMKAGGAANVANNLISLGARVLLLSCTGQDDESDLLVQQILNASDSEVLFIKQPDRFTTMKSRYITSRGRHIVRVDQETLREIDDETVDEFMQELSFKPDLVVVSDYAKGVVTRRLMSKLISHVKSENIIVDPKGSDFMRYGKVGAITPNLGEFQRIGGNEDEVQFLDLPCLAKHIIVTRGYLGCRLFQCQPWAEEQASTRRYLKGKDFSVHAREVGDPTGCGDSFMAGLAYQLAVGAPLDEACKFANACGACSYDHTGAHVVTHEEVVTERKKGEFYAV